MLLGLQIKTPCAISICVKHGRVEIRQNIDILFSEAMSCPDLGKGVLFLQRGLVSNLRRRLKRIQGSSEVVSSTVAFKALRTDGKLYI